MPPRPKRAREKVVIAAIAPAALASLSLAKAMWRAVHSADYERAIAVANAAIENRIPLHSLREPNSAESSFNLLESVLGGACAYRKPPERDREDPTVRKSARAAAAEAAEIAADGEWFDVPDVSPSGVGSDGVRLKRRFKRRDTCDASTAASIGWSPLRFQLFCELCHLLITESGAGAGAAMPLSFGGFCGAHHAIRHVVSTSFFGVELAPLPALRTSAAAAAAADTDSKQQSSAGGKSDEPDPTTALTLQSRRRLRFVLQLVLSRVPAYVGPELILHALPAWNDSLMSPQAAALRLELELLLPPLPAVDAAVFAADAPYVPFAIDSTTTARELVRRQLRGRYRIAELFPLYALVGSGWLFELFLHFIEIELTATDAAPTSAVAVPAPPFFSAEPTALERAMDARQLLAPTAGRARYQLAVERYGFPNSFLHYRIELISVLTLAMESSGRFSAWLDVWRRATGSDYNPFQLSHDGLNPIEFFGYHLTFWASLPGSEVPDYGQTFDFTPSAPTASTGASDATTTTTIAASGVANFLSEAQERMRLARVCCFPVHGDMLSHLTSALERIAFGDGLRGVTALIAAYAVSSVDEYLQTGYLRAVELKRKVDAHLRSSPAAATAATSV